MYISRIDVWESFRCGPDKLRYVYFGRREQSNHDAGQHRRQHDIPPGILSFFGERGNTVKSDVRQHGDGCATEECAGAESGRIIEGPRKETGIRMRVAEDVTHRSDKDHHDDRSHSCDHTRVDARRCFHTADV